MEKLQVNGANYKNHPSCNINMKNSCYYIVIFIVIFLSPAGKLQAFTAPDGSCRYVQVLNNLTPHPSNSGSVNDMIQIDDGTLIQGVHYSGISQYYTQSYKVWKWAPTATPPKWGYITSLTSQTSKNPINWIHNDGPNDPTTYKPAGCIPTCDDQYTAAVTECGTPENVEWDLMATNGCVPVCKPDCTDLLTAKEVECGGPEYLDTWDTTTCTGTCKCDDIEAGETEYQSLVNFCGSPAKTDYHVETCSGKCKTCDEEYQALEDECGIAGLVIKEWDDTTCSGSCSDDCTDEYNILETECGLAGITNWDDKTCTGQCKQDCTTQYNQLETECGLAGIQKFNDATCTGNCNGCDERTEDCSAKCGGSQNVLDYSCTDGKSSTGAIIALNETKCECADPVQNWGDITLPDGSLPQLDGGETQQNPDGSITQTFPNGSTITYSADGKTQTARRPDGSTITRTDKGNGVTEYYAVDPEGNYQKRTDYYVDGRIVKSDTETGVTKIPPPPAGTPTTPVIVQPSPNTTTTGGGTTTTGGGTDIQGNPLPPAGSWSITYPATAGTGTQSTLSAINTDGFKSAVSALGAKLPTASMLSILNIFGSSSVGPPVVHFHLPSVTLWGKTTPQLINELDFSPWDICARVLRYSLAALVLIYGYRRILSIWGA